MIPTKKKKKKKKGLSFLINLSSESSKQQKIEF
jgi:hypothetical protein